MKKITYFVLSVFLCSCAGNPPAWWNPSGRYTAPTANEMQPVLSPAAQTGIKPTVKTAVSPAEETFTPEETVFEEMDLKPEADESLEEAVDTLQPSILND